MQSKIVFDKNIDNLYMVCILAEENFDKEYIIYENNDKYLFGLGIESYINFYGNKTVVNVKGEKTEFVNNAFSDSMIRASKLLSRENWKGFGFANFELSRYIHLDASCVPDDLLLKIIVPKLRVSFSKNEAILESSDSALLQKSIDFIQNNNKNNLNNSLNERVKREYDISSKIKSFNAEKYKSIVKKAVDEINSLQYQKVILSRKVTLDKKIDMVASYFAGRKGNSPARSFLLNIGNLQASGFSPETVVEVDKNRMVSTQPLAGTRAVAQDSVEDKKLEDELTNDTKEIAEHAVSVKLAFEEMQQVCNGSDIFLDNFMSVIPRGRVRHLGSRLRGKLREECNSWDAFYALFPAVTATGIPKMESIESISRHEEEVRDLYSGCVMTCDSEGCIDAALVLRSFYQTPQESWLRAGAGLVPKSIPERELEETCEKLGTVASYLKFQ